MLYALLTTAATILVLTFVASYVIISMATADRSLRGVLLVSVIVTPFVALFSFVRVLLFGSKPVPYSEELGKIEDEIERERASDFDDKIIHPSFSHRWRMSYLFALERAAKKVAQRSVRAPLCGASRLH